uniref:Non-structural maintenance of chromosomes element 4 n=1 Tax=Sinocyclocheilus anshuiensis TaxID=1608454 RepID=A0A671PIZ3_9TELE
MSDSKRRSRGSQEESAGTSNGLGGRNRSERACDMGDEDDIGAGPSGISEEDDDPTRRREIRSKYRDLINQVQQNREDMLNPANNKLTDVLEEANKLFANVRQAREAALDAQLLVLATDLGKEKASQLHAEGSAFDPSAFAEHLLSFMGLNRLEDESGQDGNLEGYLPQSAWQRLAKRSEYCFKTAPSFHYISKLNYSFFFFLARTSRTVENIFHTSFLIRVNNMYYGCIIAPVEEGEVEPGGAAVRHQCVEIIDAFDIKGALIPAPEVLSQ